MFQFLEKMRAYYTQQPAILEVERGQSQQRLCKGFCASSSLGIHHHWSTKTLKLATPESSTMINFSSSDCSVHPEARIPRPNHQPPLVRKLAHVHFNLNSFFVVFILSPPSQLSLPLPWPYCLLMRINTHKKRVKIEMDMS